MAKINMVNFMSNIDRESWVHRLDPRTKIALILFFTSIPLLTPIVYAKCKPSLDLYRSSLTRSELH